MTNMEDTTLCDTSPLLPRTSHIAVYKRRWYILLIFSLVAILQDTVWNTWGPIDHTATFLYGWSHDLIALFANYGSILYIVAFLPAVYVLERSVRTAMLFCSGFMALGTILRCGFLQDHHISQEVFTVSCHICSILNGISNIVVGSAPLAISAVWFPPEERVTATTIAQVFNGLGTGMSFLLASQIVRPIDDLIEFNRTVTAAEVQSLERDIQWYMYSNAIPAGVLFILIIAYFPSAPKKPPSISSNQARLDFLTGFKEVMKSRAAWLIAIGCSIPQGIVVAWTAMMVVNLTQICVGEACLTQNWVNYLGIYATVVSTIAAILVARAADMVKGKLKEAIIILLCLAAVVFLMLSLISIGVFQFGNLLYVQISVYFLLLLGNSLVVSSMPLAMELAMEICYPAAEGVVGGWISIWFNIATVVFLSLFGIPGIGTSWLDYVLPLSCVVAIPFILPIKVEYKRMLMDVNKEETNIEGDKYGSNGVS
eukprot:GFUD01005760.1.p1 GENE.GFUD01005760.1~~GFUD01005760.1.p1  ORF type:complete len:483 (+),score=101.39 GFUD01005760.1:82-1530(+)